ncbi:MAG TPA: hypothetical protein VLE43_12430 [Candidatus Saccharimonadia bacterium]|nr:hypothetical protein [Candidatus Saccharimonadia bacterium]
MSQSPSAHLVAEVQRLIRETFEVSDREAYEHAFGLVLLAEGWGTPETAAEQDWLFRVRKDLGKRLKWRSEEVRKEFEALLKQAEQSYEMLIDRHKPGGRTPI